MFFMHFLGNFWTFLGGHVLHNKHSQGLFFFKIIINCLLFSYIWSVHLVYDRKCSLWSPLWIKWLNCADLWTMQLKVLSQMTQIGRFIFYIKRPISKKVDIFIFREITHFWSHWIMLYCNIYLKGEAFCFHNLICGCLFDISVSSYWFLELSLVQKGDVNHQQPTWMWNKMWHMQQLDTKHEVLQCEHNTSLPLQSHLPWLA